MNAPSFFTKLINIYNKFMIEVEKRVLLNKKDLKKFLGKLTISGEKVKEFKRFTMVKIANSDFTPNKDNLIDLKIRTTKESSLFTIKKRQLAFFFS